MVFAILLDSYQGTDGPNNYTVTFEGTEAACDAETQHDGRTFPEPKASYVYREVKRKALNQGAVVFDGVIAELTPLEDSVSDTAPAPSKARTKTVKRKKANPAKRRVKSGAGEKQ